MTENGITAVRIPHTTPPRSLLDAAEEHGLWIMVGLSIEQKIGYFIDRKTEDIDRIEDELRAKVRACSGHPSLLCYALGNEIPASTARWLGRRRVEQILERMYWIVKEEDPDGIVSYVNYPSTEYLHLPFLDLLCFNVYLESQDRLDAYLARLHNIAGERPLLMSELGLDALRNGEQAQAEVLQWQIRTSMDGGCAGVFIFSWTDEWYRAGAQVDDWAFGLTDIDRNPKPALAAVRESFSERRASGSTKLLRISVVVCSYNGSRTIGECCEWLTRLNYRDYEVIVVDDGSNDNTAEIAEKFGFRVIRCKNNDGLSNARNVGLAAATGEIVAYIDDDAFPDVDWLLFLAAAFDDPDCVAAGGPNVAAPNDSRFARFVNYAPGNPTHCLITDTEAEQLPGCNLAIRRTALQAVGGFDAQFHVAGDDVDVCLRLRQRGGTLTFCPGAMVWHHRRGNLRAYLEQQAGYGAAEYLLDRKWKNVHDSGWRSTRARVYGSDIARGLGRFQSRVYHGVWGHAPFQSVYEQRPQSRFEPEDLPGFQLGLVFLLVMSVMSPLWRPLLLALPLLIAGIAAIVLGAIADARRSARAAASPFGMQRVKWIATLSLLYTLQPIARHWGRFREQCRALRPSNRLRGLAFPRPITGWRWSEDWLAPEKRIKAVEDELLTRGVPLTRGSDYDRWDLEVHGGLLGSARISIAVEDHSGAAQMIRYRLMPHTNIAQILLIGILVMLAALAAVGGAWMATVAFGVLATAIASVVTWSCGRATSWGKRALNGIDS